MRHYIFVLKRTITQQNQLGTPAGNSALAPHPLYTPPSDSQGLARSGHVHLWFPHLLLVLVPWEARRTERLRHVCLATYLCPTLCDHMDCGPLGSSVHGDSPGKNTGVGSHALL